MKAVIFMDLIQFSENYLRCNFFFMIKKNLSLRSTVIEKINAKKFIKFMKLELI